MNSIQYDENIKIISEILENIRHPISGDDLLNSGAVKEIVPPPEGEKRIRLSLAVGEDRKHQLAIEAQIRTTLVDRGLVNLNPKIKFVVDEKTRTPQKTSSDKKLEKIRYIVAVGSGKGGVGKSTVAVNVAAGLAHQGLKVGLLDADIYGPSVGKLVGLTGKINLALKKKRIIPIEKYKMKIVSFSFFIDETQAVAWRGPMLGKALEQFLYDVEWGDLDYLIIDLPPGTGDTHLSLAQLVEVHGALLVTTPQSVAVQDALRLVKMFEQVNIPTIGIVENMSSFLCSHCNESSAIFSKGGGEALSKESESTLLSKIPLTFELMHSSENGIPITSKEIKKLKGNSHSIKMVQQAFNEITSQLTSILNKVYQKVE